MGKLKLLTKYIIMTINLIVILITLIIVISIIFLKYYGSVIMESLYKFIIKTLILLNQKEKYKK